MTEMIDGMHARMALLADPAFRPSDYPGLTSAGRSSEDQGWIAWFILPDVRVVPSFASWHKDERLDAIRSTVTRVLEMATAFIRRVQARSAPYERARVERSICDALNGKGNGGRDYVFQDASEPEREHVNWILDIECPWVIPAAAPSLENEIVSHLRAHAKSAEYILQTLVLEGLDHGPEGAELRREIAQRPSDEARSHERRGSGVTSTTRSKRRLWAK
jgi:hypothetical protein